MIAQPHPLQVEVFKTSVDNPKAGFEIVSRLTKFFPTAKINFDLEDCDRILRIEPYDPAVNLSIVVAVVEEFGFEIELL